MREVAGFAGEGGVEGKGFGVMASSTGKYYDLVPKGFAANLRFRRELLEMAAGDAESAGLLWRMCSEDMLFYVNAMCWTYDPRGAPSKVPFITYDFQDDAMEKMRRCVVDGEDFALPKSRDMGASWMGLTVFEWFWHFRDQMSFLLISRNEDYVDKSGNSKSLFWKIDFLHRNQPRWLLPTGRWLGGKDPNRRMLHLGNADNGSVIDGESTTGDAGRGDRRTAMFIDEHAAFSVDDGFKVLRATRDTTNCRGFNSTPQGANNAFYEVVHNTAARVIRLHWSQHPEKNVGLYSRDSETGEVRLLDDFRGEVVVREKGDKEMRRVAFPDDYPFKNCDRFKLRSPWFDKECARCVNEMEIGQELEIDFLGSDYQFFDAETVMMLRKKYCRPPELVGELEIDPDTCEPKRFVEDPKGRLNLWITLDGEGRVSADRQFVMGSDVSAGTGASNSVSSVVDRVTGEKVGVWRDSHARPTLFGKYSVALAKWFNQAFLAWDSSGPAGTVFSKSVMAAGYGRIYYRRNEKRVGRKLTDEPGYFLNADAKTTLLEDYRNALCDHKFINRSDHGMAECLQFVRCSDGKTVEHSAALTSQDPSGARTAHGDEVIADALANLSLVEQAYNQKAEKPDVPVGSLAWRREQMAMEKAAQSVDQLGEGW